jgi:hypothetical protein
MATMGSVFEFSGAVFSNSGMSLKGWQAEWFWDVG